MAFIFNSPILLLIGPITIRTPRDLDALAIQTYLLAGIVAAAFVGVAALVANVIKFEGGAHPRDSAKRRMYFWSLLLCAVTSLFAYNRFGITPTITPSLQPRFFTVGAISVGVLVVTYVMLGFLLSKLFPTGKLASWFGARR